MKQKDNLSLLDVVDNLTAIVDAEGLEDIEITQKVRLTPRVGEEGVIAGSNEETLAVIRATIRSASQYLHTLYSKIDDGEDATRLHEGMRTIMVLVGEAGKKLEKFDKFFAKKIAELPEYKEIENFYSKRVFTEAPQKKLKVEFPHGRAAASAEAKEEWEFILDQLLQEQEVEEVSGAHVLNDLSIVQGDHLYELFYMKNEAAHPFYSLDLARTIKLACDFGEYATHKFTEDPLVQLRSLADKGLQVLAQRILEGVKAPLHAFYRQALQQKEETLVLSLHNAIMALMLASNPRNLLRQSAKKGCYQYFADFQLFLREVLLHRDYERLFLYEVAEHHTPFFKDVFALANALCFHLYVEGPWKKEVIEKLQDLIEEGGAVDTASLPRFLESAYYGLHEVLKRHPSGPILKAVDLIREEEAKGGIIDSLQGKKVDIGALREMYTMANGAMITTLALGILAYIAVELSLRSKPKLVKASICLQELRDVESRI